MSGTVIALGRLFAIYLDVPVLPLDNTILIRNKRTSIVLKRLAILVQKDEEKLQTILFRMHPVAYHNYLLESPMVHPIES